MLGVGALSARLELERDGNFAQLLERIRPEGHKRHRDLNQITKAQPLTDHKQKPKKI
jgi:hypothetical protein